ncbi:uracil-DNA glycosylase [Bacillus pinisoli]|uniref:uracil-DNA glycosylase n=1 Tax=Bacillus pinisoli TaxID=2901866 RepID=UPI001FF250FF|nr:uracil-DNA glycosylase [Bacillus pinisoli]
MSQRINCFQCKYFYTTWDQNFPRGCKAFNFKTSQMPSVAVQRSSGSPCMKFEKKPAK